MYGKLFSATYTGSMVGAGTTVFAVWPYALANCDEDGLVELNPKFLALVFGDTGDRIQEAIDFLRQPDPDSRSKAEDGRRLVQEGQFLYRIVNYAKYIAIRDKEGRRAYQRDWDRKNRPSGHQRAKKTVRSDAVRHGPTNPTHIDIDVDVIPPIVPQGDGALRDEFEKEFWPNVPTKVAKGAARTAYAKARKKVSKETILNALPAYRSREEQRKRQDGDRFRPLHPSSWLNQERWDDELSESAKPATLPVVRGADGLTQRERVLRGGAS